MAKEPAAKKRRLSPPGDDTKSAPGFTRWNLEQDYEKRARKGKKEQKNEKLPIKTAEGDVVRQEEKEPEVAQKDDDADSFLASDDGEEEEQEQEKPEETGPKLSPKEEILQAKEDLARMASVMSEDPEDNIGLLASIAEITMSKNVVVKKLGMGTMLAIFKDIIPGYRIRPLGRDDLTSKVSKDVRKLRTFEQGLLNAYKSYLQLLKGLAKGSASGDADAAGLASVAIACACTLLENVSHFNERSVLVAIVVGKLSVRNPTAKDQDYTRCLNALEHTFKDDDDGYISLEIVGQLTKMMKTRNWQCHESVLNSLLHLRLLNEFSGKASSERVDKAEKEEPVKKPTQKKVFRTKRERKVMRERKEVEKEMSVADAAVSYEERDKNQAETLKLVFLAYFRILKARVDHLMGAVLEGLARYAHLINQEFFGDILEVLKDLINEASVDLQTETGDDLDENRNATRETLLCITTAFALLHGQMDVIKSASSLHLDLDFFIKTLYNIILPLSQDPDLELSAKNGRARDPNGLSIPATLGTKVNVATTTVLFLRSLQAVLLPPTNTRSVPPLRVAAFVKQLCTAALHLPQKSSVATIGLLQQVSKTHSKKMMALWHTEDRKGDGVFDPLGKLESANPLAATVWEGELLRLHFDPKVRDTVKQLEKNMRGD